MRLNDPVGAKSGIHPLLLGLLLGTCAILFGGCATPSRDATAHNRGLIQRYFAEWANQGSVGAADELIAADVTLRHPQVTLQGREAYKQSMAGFRRAFPDLHFLIEDQVSQQDKVLVRWTLSGTQSGEFQGHPPTGRRISIAGMSLFRIEQGKIREIWVNMDRLGMQEQLGFTPVQTSPPKNE